MVKERKATGIKTWPELLLLEKGEHGDLITAPEYLNSLKKILTN